MQKSTLISLLKTFSPKELKRLEEFLHSPIHNQSIRCQQLFDLIKPYFGDFDHIGLSKERIFAQLFPKKKQFDSSLSVVMRQLTKLVQDFLVFLKFEADKGQQAHLLLSSLTERNLDKHFLKIWKSVEKEQQNLPIKQINDYYNQYLLTMDKLYYDVGQQKQWLKIDFNQIINNLDLFHLIGQLKYYGVLANVQSILPQATQQKIPIEAINQTIEFHRWKEIPIVQLHHTTLLMTLFPENPDNHFSRLKTFLQSSNTRQISVNDLYDAYSLALNHCKKKITNEQEKDYRKEMFELYKSMIKQGLWYQEGGYVSHRKLKNVISLGARFGEFDWSENFLQQNLPDIDPNYQDIVQAFNLGVIYYYKKDYKKAMNYLNKVKNLDAYYVVDADTSRMKIYYEQGETNVLMDLVRSFKALVDYQKELSADTKEAYINFAKFLVTLYRIQHKQLKSRKTLKKLKEEVEETNLISDKEWLEDKIAILERKKKS